MTEIYLIRHTTPAVAKGVCYGQTDLDVIESFTKEAAVIRQHLPEDILSVHSSPLQRCSRLASHLFPAHPIALHDDLMEIHCGEWEMRGWDELPKEIIDPWMKDFVNVSIPGGESYLDLHKRVTRRFDTIRAGQVIKAGESTPGSWNQEAASQEADDTTGAVAIVAHGGVIRSILSYITDTPLIDSFKVFSLHYGCVVRLFEPGGSTGTLQYEMLSNVAPEQKEQHKPRSFY